MHLEEELKQDKVNYAVSEREDRVTDLTMLTRMTGCTGMYRAATGLQMGSTDSPVRYIDMTYRLSIYRHF